MAYAAKAGLVVLTHDLDFSAILAATKGKKPSVVQIRAQNISPEAIGTQVVAALRHTDAELETGALLTIDPDRTRIRLLPLQQTPQNKKKTRSHAPSLHLSSSTPPLSHI